MKVRIAKKKLFAKNKLINYLDYLELIAKLKKQIPNVEKLFNVHHRIGEGTFSTVFLGSLKGHEQSKRRKFFAIKHLIPTIHPSHVERELKCLMEIGLVVYTHNILLILCVNLILLFFAQRD